MKKRLAILVTKQPAAVSMKLSRIRRSYVRIMERLTHRLRFLSHGPVYISLAALVASLSFVTYSAIYQLKPNASVVVSGTYENELIKQELAGFLKASPHQTPAAALEIPQTETAPAPAAVAEAQPAVVVAIPAGQSLVLLDEDLERYREAVKHLTAKNGNAMEEILAEAKDPLLTGTLQAIALIQGAYAEDVKAEKAKAWLADYSNLPHRPLIERIARGGSPKSFFYPGEVALTNFSLDTKRQDTANKVSSTQKNLPVGPLPGSPSASPSKCNAALSNARSMFQNGEDKALTAALSGCSRISGGSEGFYIAGLSAWRLKEYGKAAHFFSLAYRAPGSNPWDKSASAFWAYRSYSRMGSEKNANSYLSAASEYPTTFYGLLARKALEDGDRAIEPAAQLKARDRQLLLKQTAVRRIVALQEIGLSEEARSELAILLGKAHVRQRRQLFALADHVGLRVFAPDHQTYSRELVNGKGFGLSPNGGFKADPALIFALAKKESRFNPEAVSPRGAVGLMQLMPGTAQYLKRQARLNDITPEDLKKPGVNLQLGQAYVRYLLDKPEIGQNIFYLLAAYNAGPGNLVRWQQSLPVAKKDPLLFIESLPSAETREFVEKVTADYWHYRLAMGAGSPSMSQLLAGKWPEYLPFATQMASLAEADAVVAK